MKATRISESDILIEVSHEIPDETIEYYGEEVLEELIDDELRMLEDAISRTIKNFDYVYLTAKVEQY